MSRIGKAFIMEDHDTRIARNKEDIAKLDQEAKESRTELWQTIDDIKKALAYRLPLWATFLLMALSSALTGFIVRAYS